jgi:hypothetical protein
MLEPVDIQFQQCYHGSMKEFQMTRGLAVLCVAFAMGILFAMCLYVGVTIVQCLINL